MEAASPTAPRLRQLSPHRLMVWSCCLLSPFSLGVGTYSLGLQVPVLLAAAVLLVLSQGFPPQRHASSVLLLLAALGAHFVMSMVTSPCSDTFAKSLVSLGLFALLLLSLDVLAATSPDQPIAKDMRMVLGLIVASLCADALWLKLSGASAFIRPSGIFSEPSHLALSATPLIVGLACSKDPRDRRWGWGAFVVITLVSASATLFLLVALCLLLSLFAQRSARTAPMLWRALGAVSALAVLVAVSPYRDDFVARIAGLSQVDVTANVSSIVYANGWEMAAQNFVNTSGLGLGFNRMGCDPRPETASGELLDYFDIGDTNYNDGSFTFAKMLSEFGVFGVGLWLLCTWLLLRTVRRRSFAPLARPETAALLISAAAVMALGALIRGTNYFSGPFLFGVYALLCAFVPTAPGTQPGPQAIRTSVAETAP